MFVLSWSFVADVPEEHDTCRQNRSKCMPHFCHVINHKM